MFCPRCGHQNEAKNRHCSNCGERLPELTAAEAKGSAETGANDAPNSGPRALGRRLIGSTRRERGITLGIAAALVIAVIAFLALPADEDDDGEPGAASGQVLPADDDRDPFIQDADAICIESKQALDEANQQAAEIKQSGLNSLEVVARAVPPVTRRMREQLAELDPPPQYEVKAVELDAALVRLEAAGERAARFTAKNVQRGVTEYARMERAARAVQEILEELGLTGCEAIAIR